MIFINESTKILIAQLLCFFGVMRFGPVLLKSSLISEHRITVSQGYQENFPNISIRIYCAVLENYRRRHFFITDCKPDHKLLQEFRFYLMTHGASASALFAAQIHSFCELQILGEQSGSSGSRRIHQDPQGMDSNPTGSRRIQSLRIRLFSLVQLLSVSNICSSKKKILIVSSSRNFLRIQFANIFLFSGFFIRVNGSIRAPVFCQLSVFSLVSYS